ncbi:hypothetical protein [Magnetospirillum sp. UT-4]|uniref:hypothetical protein n=1 Tax=Magnetospirillum sp. UT-4 TaxID=2681467 RepID=UPI00137EE0F9|nr:hypothetical protein [Magnetospirillum sp. UT-4]CAA7622237.1 conserved hypothetical protein [Magnetospirillum sp. UT-4]
MAPPTRFSTALANLQKSHDFLLRIIDACERMPESPQGEDDREMLAAVVQLALMTERVVETAQHSALSGGKGFRAALALPQPEVGAGAVDLGAARQQVIMQMCMMQSEKNWVAAKSLKDENDRLRQELAKIYADVAAARAALVPPAIAAVGKAGAPQPSAPSKARVEAPPPPPQLKLGTR